MPRAARSGQNFPRHAERQAHASLPQEPPRLTLILPSAGPEGFSTEADRILEGNGRLSLTPPVGAIAIPSQPRAAIQIVCRPPLRRWRAEAEISSTRKPARRRRRLKVLSGAADQTASTPPLLSARKIVLNPLTP